MSIVSKIIHKNENEFPIELEQCLADEHDIFLDFSKEKFFREIGGGWLYDIPEAELAMILLDIIVEKKGARIQIIKANWGLFSWKMELSLPISYEHPSGHIQEVGGLAASFSQATIRIVEELVQHISW